jgi:hypothetical protein
VDRFEANLIIYKGTWWAENPVVFCCKRKFVLDSAQLLLIFALNSEQYNGRTDLISKQFIEPS